MARLEDLKKDAVVRGVLTDRAVTVVGVKWHGQVVDLVYRDAEGKVHQELVFRDREPVLEIVESGRAWSFDGDGKLLRLVSEAQRIHLAYLFDPLLAVHTSHVDPLPHQITAVYEEMLPRQPLRFLLADDPGAGKTIMTGLLIKELLMRGDLKRCLIVCPGSLVEQWQDELKYKFHLDFAIITRESIEAAVSGNPFLDHPLAIARLDHLARNEELQGKLEANDWDLVVCDEAHKMSASYFGSEVKETKRYKLGKLLSAHCRHFLLLTATPHNGREADFQLFMALLDGDRFEGKFRDGVHQIQTDDLKRRLSKEEMYTFEGKPLFPERRAYSVNYKLSEGEIQLYSEVTAYVREGMNQADRLAREGQGKRGNSVGFALQILQRRLASSPAAIHESLKRRRERLERRLREEEAVRRGAEVSERESRSGLHDGLRTIREEAIPYLSDEDIEDLDDAPESEVERVEEQIADTATAAMTIGELRKEIGWLRRLENLALRVRNSKTDRKWEELRELLDHGTQMFDPQGRKRKLIIFTEHRDTLNYLRERIVDYGGRADSVVTIHGSLAREERRNAQERFIHDPEVRILLATDAAGEGVNLQRAHLMVNYDLPWNPNRIEQRFGRIHRIGQHEVCHMWNLVAGETREGDVWDRLFTKLEQERLSLGGHVFDVLGQVFSESPLRELLINAIRYGDDPEVRARLERQVDDAFDHERLQELVEDRALARDTMDVSKVMRVREDMERAEARRLQPHFVREFFLEAFRLLGGSLRQREAGRYEITHVPGLIRARDRQVGIGAAVAPRYERITFDKSTVNVEGKSPATFIAPGHPLLDATIDLVRERYGHLLKQGAVLIDPADPGEDVRVLFYLQSDIQDGRLNANESRRLVSRRLYFVETDERGEFRDAGPAPYLDYDWPGHSSSGEAGDETASARVQGEVVEAVVAREEWLRGNLEAKAVEYAITHLVQRHFEEVKSRRIEMTGMIERAVKERLLREINYWDMRANDQAAKEQAGTANALNERRFRERANDLEARLQRRTEELQQERNVSPLSPVVIGGAVVVPAGALQALGVDLQGLDMAMDGGDPEERARVEKLAMQAVMEAERVLGREPRDVSAEKRGYDIESLVPDEGRLVFIEVKGRNPDAETILVTKNEILTALNAPDDFVLALVTVDGHASEPKYLRRPFQNEPDFEATSVNYKLGLLMNRAGPPS